MGRKDFHNFHWTRRTSVKKGHEKLVWEDFFLSYGFLEEEENECVKKN